MEEVKLSIQAAINEGEHEERLDIGGRGITHLLGMILVQCVTNSAFF